MVRSYVPAALEIALAAFLAAVVACPIAVGVGHLIAAGDLDAVAGAFRGRALALLARSLALAGGATALALAAGVPAGFALARTDAPGRRTLRALYLIAIFVPPALAAVSWVSLLGTALPRTPLAATFLLAATHVALVVVIVERGASAVPRAPVEAALIDARPRAALLRVDLPLARRSIAAAGLLVFILAFRNHAVPSLLGVSAYPEEIFLRYAARADHAGALALSMPALAVACLAIGIRAALGRDPLIAATAGLGSPLYRLGRARIPTAVTIALPIIAALAVPLLGPIRTLGTLAESIHALREGWPALRASIGVALGAAAVAAVVSAPWGFVIAERRGAGGLARELLALIAFAVPPVVFAVSMIAAWNRAPTRWLLDGWPGIAFAHAAIFLPFALEPAIADIRRIERETIEGAAIEPVGRFQRWSVLLPRLPGLAAGALLIVALSFGELEAGLLLAPPGTQTVMARIHHLTHFDAREDVAALSIVSLACVGIAVAGLGIVRRLVATGSAGAGCPPRSSP
ncbi:MAG: iron ABC transporter permease [Planctomycetes bacterium]|nr:iron ABC transporter permease [Planctomycetota bacterium]